MNVEKVKKFLNNLSAYKKRLKTVRKSNNDEIIKELIYRIEKYSNN